MNKEQISEGSKRHIMVQGQMWHGKKKQKKEEETLRRAAECRV